MLTYTQTLEYLDSLVNYEKTGIPPGKKDFDLDRLKEALKVLGGPERTYRSVHIAGTKGKGSVSTFTSAILERSGFTVGLYTSPHLYFERERIKINGVMISEEDFAGAFDLILGRLGDPFCRQFSYFEIYTLIAIVHFSMNKVDFAVFETGMGGRLDATNVIDSEVSAVTPVSYDHMDSLGYKIEEIAGEKAAIIKGRSHCISSHQEPSVIKIIEEKCREAGASLSVVGRDITYRISHIGEEGSSFDVEGLLNSYRGCHTNMLGDFQVANAATAIGICEKLLGDIGDKGIYKDRVKEGIRCAFIHGRMEVFSKAPLILIDGAQNGDSARKLKNSIEQIFRYDRLILLLGLSKDKDIKGVCEELLPIADEIILTRASVKRAQDPCIIRGYIKRKPVRVTSDVKEALGVAFETASRSDMIVVTGSFFLIGEAGKLLSAGKL